MATATRAFLAKLLSVVHPAGLAAAWILSVFGSSSTPLWALARPLIAGVASAIFLQLIVGLVVRPRALSSIVAASMIGAIAALWAAPTAVVAVLLLAVSAGRVHGAVGRFLKRMPSIDSVTVNSGFAIVILIAWLSVQAGVAANEFSYRSAREDRSRSVQPHPDIYLVLRWLPEG